MLTLRINWWKLIIALLLITAIAVCTFRACNHAQPASTSLAKGKVIPLQIPKSYKAPSGTVHTETKVVQAEHDVWLEDYYKNLLADVRNELNITKKQLKDVVAAGITSEGYISIPLIDSPKQNKDSASILITTGNFSTSSNDPKYFRYKDKFLSLAGRIINDSVDIGYKVEDSIHLVTYWKRKHFLAAKELYINGFSTNPNTNIKGLQTVKLNQATPKKWAVGINAGYYFDGNGFRPGIGIGITKTIFRF